MNKFIFLFAIVIELNIKAQIVFCPAGAEWNYNFKATAGGAPPPYSFTFVEKIKYARDTLLLNETVKILEHKEFFLECGFLSNAISLIKQKGDTVFFRNEFTNHQWQILYNFNAQVGQSWFVNFLADPDYTITVNAVNTVTSNLTNLKQLSVTLFRASNFGNTNEGSITITERFGFDGFLFNFINRTKGYCDNEWFQRFLCYTDDQFGKIQFTNYPCDYVTERVGINELRNNGNQFILTPNPFRHELSVESSEQILSFKIFDILGKTIKVDRLDDKALKIKTENLTPGIYFIQIETKLGLQNRKVVKE